jgi:hypothetical protein
MAVDDPERRHVDRLLRDQPREAGAEADVRPIGSEKRADRMLGRGEHHVGPVRSADELLRGLMERATDDHRRDLVPECRCELDVALDDRDDLRENDDAHARS